MPNKIRISEYKIHFRKGRDLDAFCALVCMAAAIFGLVFACLFMFHP